MNEMDSQPSNRAARVLDLRRNVVPIRGASDPTTTEGA